MKEFKRTLPLSFCLGLSVARDAIFFSLFDTKRLERQWRAATILLLLKKRAF
jgi:hypothetical protein